MRDAPLVLRRPTPSIDVELLQQRVRFTDALQQVLVVLDHLAAHVHAKPLLVRE